MALQEPQERPKQARFADAMSKREKALDDAYIRGWKACKQAMLDEFAADGDTGGAYSSIPCSQVMVIIRAKF